MVGNLLILVRLWCSHSCWSPLVYSKNQANDHEIVISHRNRPKWQSWHSSLCWWQWLWLVWHLL